VEGLKMTREIELTQGFKTKVDDEEYEVLSQHKWHAVIFSDGVPYVARSVGPNKRTKKKTIYMSRWLERYLIRECSEITNVLNL
jgi:hypothetical protein